jgi:hypothetical protein
VRVRSNGSFATVVRPTKRGRYRLSITAGPTTRRRKLRAL